MNYDPIPTAKRTSIMWLEIESGPVECMFDGGVQGSSVDRCTRGSVQGRAPVFHGSILRGTQWQVLTVNCYVIT